MTNMTGDKNNLGIPMSTESMSTVHSPKEPKKSEELTLTLNNCLSDPSLATGFKRVDNSKLAGICTFCKTGFSSSLEMAEHLGICSRVGSTPYKCNISDCKFEFSNSEALGNHHHDCTGHSKKKYLCYPCHERFTTSRNLEQHLLVHTNEQPFKCWACCDTFNEMSVLNDHMHIHTLRRSQTTPRKKRRISRNSESSDSGKSDLDVSQQIMPREDIDEEEQKMEPPKNIALKLDSSVTDGDGLPENQLRESVIQFGRNKNNAADEIEILDQSSTSTSEALPNSDGSTVGVELTVSVSISSTCSITPGKEDEEQQLAAATAEEKEKMTQEWSQWATIFENWSKNLAE